MPSVFLRGEKVFARVQWESMFFGIPFIGTPVGAVPDIIKHKINGFIVKDNEDIRNAITSLMNKTYWETISSNAKLCANTKGPMQIASSKIVQFIKEIQKRKTILL